MQDAIDAIQKFGFPIVMAVGMGYYIYYIWRYVTEEVTPMLEKSHLSLINVIDQIRMLDNDLIRLQQKVNVVLEYEKARDSESRIANSTSVRGHSDVQVQEPQFQRRKSIKSLLDDREPGNKQKKRDKGKD